MLEVHDTTEFIQSILSYIGPDSDHPIPDMQGNCTGLVSENEILRAIAEVALQGWTFHHGDVMDREIVYDALLCARGCLDLESVSDFWDHVRRSSKATVGATRCYDSYRRQAKVDRQWRPPCTPNKSRRVASRVVS